MWPLRATIWGRIRRRSVFDESSAHATPRRRPTSKRGHMTDWSKTTRTLLRGIGSNKPRQTGNRELSAQRLWPPYSCTLFPGRLCGSGATKWSVDTNIGRLIFFNSQQIRSTGQ